MGTILRFPDSRLKQKSHDCDIGNLIDLKALGNTLVANMIAAKGLGLSAPQLGIHKRIIVVLAKHSSSEPSRPLVLINPVIDNKENGSTDLEGCLSFPGVQVFITRAAIVRVSYIDIEGQSRTSIFTGIEAKAVQHEIDHLDGKLFIDYLSPLKRSLALDKLK